MRLTPSDEQRRFAEVLDTLLTRADVPAVAAAWADGDTAPGRDLWSSLSDAGVTGLLVPERFGGLEAGIDDLVIVCEVLGRHAVPGPVAESVAAAPTLLASGRWLPELADGRILASVAAPPLLPFAADGDVADLLLLTDHHAVRVGSAVKIHRSLDAARRLAEIAPGEEVESGAPVQRALDLGTLACAAQLLGAGNALLAMAVGYARTRTQFGRPIGAFQAVRHQLADVAVALTFARPLLYAAAVALTSAGGGTPSRLTSAARDVSAAKVACGEAALLAARTALQVHGAIGYTREHGLGRYLTRVRALHLSWGTADWHRRRLLTELTGAELGGIGNGVGGDQPPPPGSRLAVRRRDGVAVSPRDGQGSAGPGVERTEEEGFE
ncbi:acyl-CoA dehydrogenase family protein [Actinoplanes sp. NPDC026670]|uniref:acyl-CoA dehydrogenase family protein n=1 Tax=Actinoplanes sp. NPDC026670 TaxID=3154700 RepID=UPI0033CEE492